MSEEYISITEFAKRAGVNRTYIYKLLSTKLSPYCLQVDNQKKLNIKALELFTVNQVDKLVDKNETDGDNLKDLIEILQEQQKVLKAELEIKNEQIRALSGANATQLQLIDQQQKLQAIAETKRIDSKPDPKPEGLLNRDKFKSQEDYEAFILSIIPRIGLFSARKDKERLEYILSLMSESERNIVFSNRQYKQAIDHIRTVDFDELEKLEEQIKKDREEQERKLEELRKELLKDIEENKWGI